MTISEAITEGQRLVQQQKGNDAYDAALESGATKEQAIAASKAKIAIRDIIDAQYKKDWLALDKRTQRH